MRPGHSRIIGGTMGQSRIDAGLITHTVCGPAPPDTTQRGGGAAVGRLYSFPPLQVPEWVVGLVVVRLLGSNVALKTQPASRAPSRLGQPEQHNWPTGLPHDPERHSRCLRARVITEVL